jgi:hypothetical protein
MADRSQHLEQIMENQTRFDLNAAIENWRTELAAQANLTTEVRRELETHLRDAIAGFQQRGLNGEESFLLAKHRVGQPQLLGEEFVKMNPATVWRERIFWAATILLAVRLWMGISAFAWAVLHTMATTPYVLNHYQAVSPFPEWIRFYLPLPSNINFYALLFSPSSQIFFLFLTSLLPVGVALLLSRGRLSQSFSWLQFFFHSRRRLLFISATLFSFYIVLLLNFIWNDTNSTNNDPMFAFQLEASLLNLFSWALLVGLIIWLMPSPNRPTQKPKSA